MISNPNHPGSQIDTSSITADKKIRPRDLLDRHANTIIEKLIELAVAGEPSALRLCIERIIPRAKPDNAIHFTLPAGNISTADNMLHITNSITKAVAEGTMTIDEGVKFTEFLKQQRWQLEEAQSEKQDEEWKKQRNW